MKPDTSDILDSILWSLETYVKPEVQSPFGRSVMVTVGNLLRHVKLRSQYEAELLFADNNDLETVLARVVAGLEKHPQLSQMLGADLERTRRAGATVVADRDKFPTIQRLTACATDLREALDQLLKALGAVRADFQSDTTYVECRREIRTYLARQLQRSDKLISPAFVGGRR